MSTIGAEHIEGERRLPACSLRQLAANIRDESTLRAWRRFRPASCRTVQAGSLRSPKQSATRL